MSNEKSPLESFLKFFSIACVSATASFYFVIHDWPDIRALLVKNNFLSFSEENYFIIAPLAQNKPYILAIAIICFAIALALAYKSFSVDQYRYFPWTMALMWFTLFNLILYKMADPVPWYGVLIGLFILTFLVWIFLKVAKAYLPQQE